MSELLNLVGEYWDLAYQEGSEGRNHDTKDDKGQKTWNNIESSVKELERKAAAFDFLQKDLFVRIVNNNDYDMTVVRFNDDCPFNGKTLIEAVEAAMRNQTLDKLTELSQDIGMEY